MNTVVTILIYAILLAVVLVVGYFYFRNKSVEDIREDVYDLFLKAEHNFFETKSGQKKMDWVVDKAYDLLPKFVQLIVTEDFLRKVFEAWFKSIKNLLDDGKIN